MNKSDLLLLLLAARDATPICGKTRLVKLMYIADKELKKSGLSTGYNFYTHYYGPYSKELISDLEKLASEKFVEHQIKPIGVGISEHVYSMAKDKHEMVEDLRKRAELQLFVKIFEDVKEKYGNMSLFMLMSEVHHKYM